MAGLTKPVGGATLSLFAGPGSTVEVLGTVSPSIVGLGNLLIGDAVADAWTPKDIFISGSIGTLAGTSNTKVAEVNSVELNAVDDVLLGSSAFQSAITRFEASGNTLAINVTSSTPPGVLRTGSFNAVFIGSNTLTVRGQGVIASQNTGLPGQQAGIVLTNDNRAATVLTLGSTLAVAAGAPTDPATGAPATGTTTSMLPPTALTTPTPGSPQVIDLFGTLTDSTGTLVISKAIAVSTAVDLLSPLAITTTYRVNGCVIGETNMCTLATGGIPTKLIQGVTLPSPGDEDSAIASAAAADAAKPIIYTATTPLIAYTPPAPIGDPTVTGVGSEEIWRGPVCDPSGGAKCS